MAGRLITITSGKGGVGKTTLVANLGVALAMQGQRVIVMDAHVGLRNLDVMLGLENRIVYDLVDVIEGRCRLQQAEVADKRLPTLSLLLGAQTPDKGPIQPDDMVRIYDSLRERYDFILIDSPPGIEEGFHRAMAPADEILVVTSPEMPALRDAARAISLIEEKGKTSITLVLNRVDPDLVRRGELPDIGAVTDLLSTDLVGIVPEDEAMLDAANRGQPVALSGDSSRAGEAFHNIARRLRGKEVGFQALPEPEVPKPSRKGWLRPDHAMEQGKSLWQAIRETAIVFSFVVNVLLVASLIVIGLPAVRATLAVKDDLVKPLLSDLDAALVGLRESTIETTIQIDEPVPVRLDLPIDQSLPMEFELPIEQNTVLRLQESVPLSGLPAQFRLPGGGGVINGSVSLSLPAGLLLPVHLRVVAPVSQTIPMKTTVRVSETISVRMEVPVHVGLGEAGLDPAIDRLRAVFRPLRTQIESLPGGTSSD